MPYSKTLLGGVAVLCAFLPLVLLASNAFACLTDEDCDNGLYCDGAETCNVSGQCQVGTLVVCNDDLACTTDICNEGTDRCDYIPNHAVCQNGQYCDGAEQCVPGVGCQAGEPIACNDGVTCTLDTCDEGLDRCTYTTRNEACNDGLWCNGTETCDAVLGCVTHDVPNCNDGVDCTMDSCDEGTDACSNIPNDGSCDDNLFCNGLEWCDAVNDCQQGIALDCDDEIACTLDFCDEGEQACVNEPQASLCSDGRYCNGTETCDAALGCLPGTAIDCNDGVACTVDSCNEALDTCNHLADNGLCDNGLWCDGEETCHRTNGCLAGTPQTCDDGVACTADSCNETEKGCDNQPNDAYCADGLFCNGHERCDAVLGCRADSTFTCEDDVACTVDSCDEGSDVCLHTANDALCNDGNPCTSPDTCNAVSGCAHETLPDATECDLDPTRPEVCRDGFCTFGCNNDPDCDDGISCTIDVCQEGFCSHQISDALCDDGLWCNGQEICLPGLGCEQGPAPDCSDGILCTVDTCNEAENRCDNTPNHALCNNGQWCDGTEVCVAEIGCTMGTARNCNDGIACTQDACDEQNDRCLHAPQDTACNDGLFCNGVEWCDPSQGCRDGNLPNCDDGVTCTTDSCSDAAGDCIHAANHTLCNDGSVCTGPDICDPVLDCQNPTLPDGTPCAVGGGEQGLCLGGTCTIGCLNDADCDDGLPCTLDSCNPSTLQCQYQPQDVLCDDGIWCNGVEGCAVGIGCMIRFPVTCNDGIDCTTDSCDEEADTCVHAPDPSLCDDAIFCNGEEICQPQVGCRAGTGVPCDDGVSCTHDSCSESTRSCLHQADNSLCNDHLWCNGQETCDAILDCRPGTSPDCVDLVSCTRDRCNEADDRCENTPVDSACSDSNPCTGPDVCLPDSGCSQPPLPDGGICPLGAGMGVCRGGLCTSGCTLNSDCSDGIACTLDTCDTGSNTCVFTPDDNLCDTNVCGANQICNPNLGCEDRSPISCNDDVACTVDTCSDNACHNDTEDARCDDGNACNGLETCDALTGCRAGTPLDCNDGIACTVDSCDPVAGCMHEARNTLCDNGLWCDGTETCDALLGCVAGTSPNCDDGVSCTDDLCSEAQDRCVHVARNTLCDNGLWCDGAETCDALLGCQAGVTPDCNDGIACTTDSCDEAHNTCTHDPNHAACDDGTYCNGVEICTPDAGCMFGEPVPCEDGVTCTVDVCVEQTRSCEHSPLSSICNDGVFCNGEESCDAVLDCQAGTPVACDDGFTCTTESCDEYAKQCVFSVNHTACNDGVFCNGQERCAVGQGCVAGSAPLCNDGVACTQDECSTALDACLNYPNNSLCSDGLACNGAETCDAVLGCRPGTPVVCTDGIFCTQDSCVNDPDGASHCAFTPNSAACSDGLFCNGQEVCDPVAGCRPSAAVNCDDGVSCTTDSCDEDANTCVRVPDSALCADDNPCTQNERCDPSQGCQADPLPDDTPCGASRVCQSGQCVIQCVEDADCSGNPCLINVCDADSGECELRYGPTCHAGAVCVDNRCQQGCGNDTDCDDGIFCAFEACNVYANLCEYTTYDILCDPDPSAPPATACDGAPRCKPFEPYCVLDDPPDCDDGIFCTQDTCVPEGAEYTCQHESQDGWCDNGTFCDGEETCAPQDASADGLGCLAATDDPCNDGVSCTEDQCLEELRVCFFLPSDDWCSDGVFCNGVETCDETNDCQAGTPPDCADTVACTTDTCDEDAQSCIHDTDNAACDDGVFCNGDETCDAAGGCLPGVTRTCDDGIPCTEDSCSEALQRCVHTPNNTICTDGFHCNGSEICDADAGCLPGTAPDCDDRVSCTTDTCDEAQDRCLHEIDHTACDDDLYCTGVETCDAVLGCRQGTPVTCSDGVSCTVDSCDEETHSCRFLPDDAVCSNGLFCDGLETCDVLLGCLPGSLPCVDNVDCTQDACNESTDSCIHQASDEACDNGVFCDGAELCDPLNGCQAGSPVVCNDAIPCTVDTCSNELARCDYQPDHAACSDTLYCNGQEQCDPSQGGCVADSSWTDCDDGIPCTEDSCSEADGQCRNVPRNERCDDDLFCNGVESCDPVLGCRAGTPPDCRDAIGCTDEWCNEDFDRCDINPRSDLCDDGLRCNGLEVCDPTEGCRAGTAPDCNDGVTCTVDTCEENEEPNPCVHQPDASLCSGDNPCLVNPTCNATEGCLYDNVADGTECDVIADLPETCLDGQCVARCERDEDCSDGVDCTLDSCSQETGLCQHEPQDAFCDDGQFCNGPETCQVLSGCVTGTAPNCDDGYTCTLDECVEDLDVCRHVADAGLCADDDPCTENLCDPEDAEDESGCSWPDAPDGTACGDGFTCLGGQCQEVDGDMEWDDEPDGDAEDDQEGEDEPQPDGDEDEDFPDEDGDIDGDDDTSDEDGDEPEADGDNEETTPDDDDDDEPNADGDGMEDETPNDGDGEGGGADCQCGQGGELGAVAMFLLLLFAATLRRLRWA